MNAQTLYIIGGSFQAEIEAEADDPDYDLDRWASPQFGWITTDLTEAKMAKVKREMENEHVEAMGEDDDREDLSWKDEGWVEPKKGQHGRAYRRHLLYLKKELIGMVVVQRVSTEHGFDD